MDQTTSTITQISFALSAIITAIPLFIILQRTGRSRWWIILVVLLSTLGGIILLWILAFGRWPKAAPIKNDPNLNPRTP